MSMVEMNQILEFTRQLAQEFHPERVILFGSYAAGHPSPDSDVDLLVILPGRGRSDRKAVQILNRLQPRFPLDLLVRTPEQIQKRMAWNDFFIRDILEQGRVLYVADHP